MLIPIMGSISARRKEENYVGATTYKHAVFFISLGKRKANDGLKYHCFLGCPSAIELNSKKRPF